MLGEGEPLTLAELARVVHAVDPGAFVVAGRIVRRAIRHDRELSSLAPRVPHWWSFQLAASSALAVIEPDELGLRDGEPLPPRITLLSAPEAEDLADRPRAEVLRDAWRALFHARVHLALDARIDEGGLATVELRDRIGRLGSAAFEEARSVLRQEDAILPPRDDRATYVEFAATFLELRAFDPGLLRDYFPAVADPEEAASVFALDVDGDAILASTRLLGAAEAASFRSWSDDGTGVGSEAAPEPGSAVASGDHYRRLLARAEEAAGRDNLVRAAILRVEAASRAGASRAGQARSLARQAIGRLAVRLRDALRGDGADPREWVAPLLALVGPATRGFWTAEARLLYDLQKVCLDHERPYYAVDLVGWVRSFGRQPLRRLLDDHSEVLIVLHLRGAARRLASARLPDDPRACLAGLLKRAVHRAEIRLRDRFRPKIAATLRDAGLAARDLPEQVAVEKLTEELLDRVVARGFLSLGDLRDALSRNNRKLPDLAGPREFFRGDRLLLADRLLAERLDGVYRRGEVYLRGLQRLSALAFGTPLGRFLTRYLALPYGGTAVALEGLEHLVEKVAPHLVEEMGQGVKVGLLLGFGTLALALIASRDFRTGFGRALRRSYRVGRDVLVAVPSWLLRSALIRRLLASRGLALACRAFVLPALLARLAWMVHPGPAGAVAPVVNAGLVFLGSSLLLTTRTGRDLEELAVDSAGRAWSWFFASLIPGLFRLVMEVFDRLLEGIERVLYTVDEWLRFRGGQTDATFGIKVVLGLAWALITYVVRFVVTLLIEPQVNPIKHFPVVTVSHKILIPLIPTMASVLAPLLGPKEGMALATVIIFLTPGIFGFLVWEFKENWRLYEANRPPTLRPVVVGHHGETLARLLKPGFHSGTIPKLFAKLRRAERKAARTGDGRAVRRHRAHLHEVEEAIRHFIDRDFRELLVQGQALGGTPLKLGRLGLSAKRITVEVGRPGRPDWPVVLGFEEHSGWLVAGVVDPGWLGELPGPARHAWASALAGLYKMAGVDLVREPIGQALRALGDRAGTPDIAFDFREDGLVVVPRPDDPAEVLYLLRPEPGQPPLVTLGSGPVDPPPLDTRALVFADAPVTWGRWVDVWEGDRHGFDHPAQLLPGLPMLPRLDPEPAHPGPDPIPLGPAPPRSGLDPHPHLPAAPIGNHP